MASRQHAAADDDMPRAAVRLRKIGRARVRLAAPLREEVGSHRSRGARLFEITALALGVTVLVAAAGLARSAVTQDTDVLRTQAGAGAPVTPAGRLSSAAQALDAALAKGGTGIRFEIVQYQTIKARPNGKRIEIPHPTDPSKTIGLADEFFLSSLESRGLATSSGFWSELRAGPVPDTAPDWNNDLLYSALDADGVTWRDDGRGWYRTDSPPGIGVDPVSVRLLSRLLRNATGAASAPAELLDGVSLAAVTGNGTVADIPGVIAADGKGFTRLRGPITFAFDATGRLAELKVSALNTNLADYDLVVDTTIKVAYDNVGALPQPTPAYDPKVVQR